MITYERPHKATTDETVIWFAGRPDDPNRVVYVTSRPATRWPDCPLEYLAYKSITADPWVFATLKPAMMQATWWARYVWAEYYSPNTQVPPGSQATQLTPKPTT